MKKISLTLLTVLIALAAYSQQIQFDWIIRAGSPGWDVVTGMTELPDGKIAIAGAYYDSIKFNGTTLTSKGSRDGFIAIYKADGSFRKAVSIGGPGFDYIKKIGFSEGSGIVAALQFNEKLRIGNMQVSGKYLNNCMVAFYDKELNPVSQHILSSNSDFDIKALDEDTNGNVSLTGWFTDTLLVDGKNYISRNNVNIFAGQISPKGKYNWFNQYVAEGIDIPFSLIPGYAGKNYMAGTTVKGDFSGEKQPPAISRGMEHLFISTLYGSGTDMEVDYPVYGNEITPVEILKDSTNLWILANFRYSAFIKGVELVSYGMSDVLLVKYNLTDRTISWCQIGGTGDEEAAGLVKSGKHLFIAGHFSGKMTFGGQTVEADKSGTGIFIASIDSDGIPGSITAIAGEGSKFPCAVFASGTGIYLTGEFTGSLKTGKTELKSAGKEDIFLARIENCEAKDPLHISYRQTNGNKTGSGWELDAGADFASYLWDNNKSASRYYLTGQPGTHSVTVTDGKGCVYSGEINLTGLKSAQIISGTESLHGFRLYPTLTKELVYWEPSSEWVNRNAVLRIFDTSGRLISSQEISGMMDATYTVDFSTKPEGSYLVEIAGEGFREISKVILKR